VVDARTILDAYPSIPKNSVLNGVCRQCGGTEFPIDIVRFQLQLITTNEEIETHRAVWGDPSDNPPKETHSSPYRWIDGNIIRLRFEDGMDIFSHCRSVGNVSSLLPYVPCSEEDWHSMLQLNISSSLQKYLIRYINWKF
jgi:hypothetical protein